jgi:hypothetical protein
MWVIIVCFTDSVEAENCALIGYYFTQIIQTFPYIHRVLWVTGFLLGFLTHEDGTDRLSRNFGKELHLLAA